MAEKENQGGSNPPIARYSNVVARFRESVEKNLADRLPSHVLQNKQNIIVQSNYPNCCPNCQQTHCICIDMNHFCNGCQQKICICQNNNQFQQNLCQSCNQVDCICNIKYDQYIIKDKHKLVKTEDRSVELEKKIDKLKQKNLKLKEEIGGQSLRQISYSVQQPVVYEQQQQQSNLEYDRLRKDIQRLSVQINQPAIIEQPECNKNDEIQVKIEKKHEKCMKKLCKKNHIYSKENTKCKGENQSLKWLIQQLQNEKLELESKIDELEPENKKLEQLNQDYYVQIESLKARIRYLEEKQIEPQVLQEKIIVEKIVEVIVEKPVEIIKHIVLEKIVEKPYEVIKTVESPPIIQEVIREVPVEVIVEKIVERIVEVPVERIVEKIIEVPRIEYVEIIKEVPRYVDNYIEVEKPVYYEQAPQIQIRREREILRDPVQDQHFDILREDYIQLQTRHDQVLSDADSWKQKFIHLELQLKKVNQEEIQNLQKDKSQFIEEIKQNHAVIDELRKDKQGYTEQIQQSHDVIGDLKQRIDMMFEEINRVTMINQYKNQDLQNHILHLENQLRLSYSTSDRHTAQFGFYDNYQ